MATNNTIIQIPAKYLVTDSRGYMTQPWLLWLQQYISSLPPSGSGYVIDGSATSYGTMTAFQGLDSAKPAAQTGYIYFAIDTGKIYVAQGNVWVLESPEYTGDVLKPVNSTVTTLATVNLSPGTYGSSDNIPVLSVNSKGLVTAVTTVAPRPPIAAGLDTTVQFNDNGALAGDISFTYNKNTNLVSLIDEHVAGEITFTTPLTTFNNLSPLTIKGDLLTRNASNNVRLGVGSDGQFLSANSAQTTGLQWASAVTSVDVSGGTTGLTTSGGPVTTTGTITLAGTVNETHGGTNQTTYATGDTLYASGANTLSKRTIGSTGNVLTVSGGVPVWAPPATSGTVTSVSVVSANGFAGTVATATSTPAITLSTTITGVLKGNGTAILAAAPGTDYLTVLSGDVTTSGNVATLATVNSNVGTFASVTVNSKGLVTAATALSGDATTSGAALTLATVNANVGTFGSSTSIPTFTVNGKGLITAASGNVVIAPAGTLTGTTLNSTVVTSSLTSVGTIGTGVWQGTGVGPTFGGTGQTSYTTGDLLYASATNILSKRGIGSSGNILSVSGGIPTWVALSTLGVTSVTGTTNQITVSPTTGAVVVSLPSSVTIAGGYNSVTSTAIASAAATDAFYNVNRAGVASTAFGYNGSVSTNVFGATANTYYIGQVNGSAAPDLVFTSNSTEKFRMSNAGLFGFGITPISGVPMTVHTGTNRNIGIFDQSSTATISAFTDAGAASALRIAGSGITFAGNGSTTQMTLLATGDFGIGVSPAAKLNVQGGTTIATLTDWNTKANTQFNLANTSVHFGIGYTAADIVELQGYDSSNSARDITMQRLGGNVGIGVTAISGVPLIIHTGSNRNIGIFDQSSIATVSGLTDAGSASALRLAGSTITFAGNGSTTQMTLSTTGLLGIGRTATTALLEVAGNTGLIVPSSTVDLNFGASITSIAAVSLGFNHSGSTNAFGAVNDTAYFGSAQSFPTVFTTAAVERMRIDASGNVGIGTTPAARLDVRTSSAGAQVMLVGNTGASTTFTAGAFSNFTDADFNIQISGVGAGTKFTSFGPSVAIPLIFNISNTEKMRLDSSGRLGIGRTPTSTLLEVASTIQAIGGSATDTSFAATITSVASHATGFNNSGSTNGYGAPTGTAYLGVAQSFPLVFTTVAAERMRIDTSGNVGIGRTSTGFILETQGTIKAYGASNASNIGIAAEAVGVIEGKMGVNNSGSTNGYGAPTNSIFFGTAQGAALYLTTSGVARAAITSSGDFITSYGAASQGFSAQAPVTGFSITIANNTEYLLLKPAGSLTSGTITMPSSPVNGQKVYISITQTIATLNIAANSGQTLENSFNSLFTAGRTIAYLYVSASTSWYRIQNPA